MSELKEVLMCRDGLSANEAEEKINEIAASWFAGDENALFDEGLEDDYIFDLF